MPACGPSQGGALILLVDDDDCFRRALAIALRLEGHRVVEAGDAAEALARLAEHRFCLALVDLLLGTERGEAVLEQIARHSPDTRLASISGRQGIDPRVPRTPGAVHLEKPLVASDVLALL